MKYTIQHIASLLDAKSSIPHDCIIEHLLFDSRKIYAPASSLFFAIKGDRRDGHQFIATLIEKGVGSFVVSNEFNTRKFKEANFIFVDDTVKALQQLAILHRRKFTIPVIGITGSNGKTIVKEWLYQLLHEDYAIVRSPKSFNSQIGVPLSVWNMNEFHTLAIFEAGISQPGEMEILEQIIQPTIGVLTNIGEAHSSGFDSLEEKEREKKILFRHADIPEALSITDIQKGKWTTITATKDGISFQITIPFNDEASIQNAITCWQVLLHLGYKNETIAKRMQQLTPVNMRLELKKAINHCVLINDSYSADLSSFEIALDFLSLQNSFTRKTVILSDFLESSLPDKILYGRIVESLVKQKVQQVIAIGPRISSALQNNDLLKNITFQSFPSTEKYLEQFLSTQFKEEAILIKGARVFAFEKIVQLLEQKVHQTILEINLNAIVQNVKAYQRYLQPSTKMMAMVKAFAYGSGGAEIAGVLQNENVDYLGVAYVDEGIELRKAGITLPVMVMNADEDSFEALVEYNLEPVLYSFEFLNAFHFYLQQEGLQHFPVHLEIETGMNRLGFPLEEMKELATFIKQHKTIKIQSVFTHLAASDDKKYDDFTHQQFEKFREAVQYLKKKIKDSFLAHIANSSAVVRYPDMQMDMVRLGIGMYGVDYSNTKSLNLQTVATLKSTIAQIKILQAGESVSYNRQTIVNKETKIATIRIGYADGYPRRLGNGIGRVWLKGKQVPIIGTVCMDMLMIDISTVADVKIGDEVQLFGDAISIREVAAWAGTIAYEIMTGISQRVKRVYFQE